ncbi:hypothetical protein CCS79_10010 [Clostridium diolis]|uniref:hypothetical protein n=1 Tax=Clostridium diolis TaxID=223919 RepID=UPI000B3FF1C8|nr:hypothetical protein [Clostridium diolis]OVE68241.1 hypothetical protein CCS79_10010 [Clostridium diolis]
MKVEKSSRHSKITGDFAEHLILYWLSKYGFECARVDHTGIDLIANNSITKEVMGISVKSRSRNEGKDGQYVSIKNEHFKKVDLACKAFGCIPYFAIVVDENDYIYVFILSKEKLLRLYPMGKTSVGWKMNKVKVREYIDDDEIIKIKFNYETSKWWGK